MTRLHPIVAAALEGTDLLKSRHSPPIAGYDSHDIEHAKHGIEECTKLYMSAVSCYLECNDHVADMVDFKGFFDRLLDLVDDDLRGPLQQRIDELRGDR